MIAGRHDRIQRLLSRHIVLVGLYYELLAQVSLAAGDGVKAMGSDLHFPSRMR